MKKAFSLILAVIMLLSLSVPAYAEAKTATGTGTGIDGPVVVEVTADENTILSVVIKEQNETPGIGSVAVEKLPSAMVDGNLIEIDNITGATVTSTAIKTAVTEALTAMGFDPANYQGAAAGGAASAEKTEETLDCDVVVIGRHRCGRRGYDRRHHRLRRGQERHPAREHRHARRQLRPLHRRHERRPHRVAQPERVQGSRRR